jgi:hypothetical protein
MTNENRNLRNVFSRFDGSSRRELRNKIVTITAHLYSGPWLHDDHVIGVCLRSTPVFKVSFRDKNK